jgi:hypothetical protein
MSMIGFPLLLIPLAIYNIFVFLMPGVAFTSPIVSVTLMSGVVWTPTFGDALIALAIVLLLFEIIKASRPGARFLTDHLLSLIVFSGATAEFLFLKALGTSDFFLLTVLTGVEFLAGAAIGLQNRRLAATPSAQPTKRQEPAMTSPAPEPKRANTIPPETKPPEMISVSPAPPSAAPPAPPVLEKKVSDWSMSDLVSDRDQSSKAESAPESDTSEGPKP